MIFDAPAVVSRICGIKAMFWGHLSYRDSAIKYGALSKVKGEEGQVHQEGQEGQESKQADKQEEVNAVKATLSDTNKESKNLFRLN